MVRGSFLLKTSCSSWGGTRYNKTHRKKHTKLDWKYSKYLGPRLWNEWSAFFCSSFSFSLFLCVCLKQRKVARLLKYLQFRDYKSKLLKTLEDDDVPQETGIYTLMQIVHTHDQAYQERLKRSFRKYFQPVCCSFFFNLSDFWTMFLSLCLTAFHKNSKIMWQTFTVTETVLGLVFIHCVCLQTGTELQVALPAVTSGGSDWPRTFWCGWIRRANSSH